MSDFRIRIQAELDEKNLTSQINALKGNKYKIPVQLDVKDSNFAKGLDALGKKIKLLVDDSDFQRARGNADKLRSSMSQLQRLQFKIDTGGATAELKKLKSQIDRFSQQSMTDGQQGQVNKIIQSYRNLENVINGLSSKMKSGNTLNSSDLDKYNTALAKTQNQIKILSSELSSIASIDDRMQFSNKIETWLNNNTKATDQAKTKLQEYIAMLRDAGTVMTTGQLNDVKKSFGTWTSSMQAMGKTGKSFFDDFKRAFSQIFQFAGAYGLIQNVAFQVPQQMWSAVRDVDDAMTSLQMATGVSNDQAKELMSTYAQLGNQLKATSTDIAASATEWLKQGQSIANSEKLAQDSIILSKIGDLSSEEATSTITAAMKSYDLGVDEVMDFVDKISAIDMASATDVGGLATAFNEVAANARNAGIEVDKLLSYAAVIGETTQESMSSVGTSLNAIFSRMGNIKLSRLKDPETGEDLSNTETSLRNVGIELRESTGEFRDFDEVLDEVAANWQNYSEVTQRSIASSLAGTHHMNEIMVLMQNYSDVQKYMNEAADSAGTSMQKYEAYTDSLAGRFCLYVQKCA